MKVLFCIHKRNRLRNFTSVILRLAELGHSVRLGFSSRNRWETLPPELAGSPSVSYVPAPAGRSDRWGPLAAFSRAGLDILRYFDPGYEDCTGLKARALRRVDEAKRMFFEEPRISGRLREAREVLAWIESQVPGDPVVEAFLRRESPDVLLVSPLVQVGSKYQVDHVKAAHALGIPVAFLPFSWDNLTNKGLIRVVPDRVFVWNQTQKDEAVRLHGMPEDRVEVCGAWRFDQFFALKPSASREDFCAGMGLDPARPYVLYLCSSEFTAPREVEFVKKWIGEIRRSADPKLRDCGVLVKPYPDLKRAFEGFDAASFPGTAVWRATLEGAQGLYDGLHHAALVVGINTSAMIEASILGKPVHTLLVPEYHAGQAGTRHFHYFSTVGGGLLEAARDFDEHRRQLSESLADGRPGGERGRRFVEAFLRPFGRDKETTSTVVDRILALAGREKPAPPAPPPAPPRAAFDFIFEDGGFGKFLAMALSEEAPYPLEPDEAPSAGPAEPELPPEPVREPAARGNGGGADAGWAGRLASTVRSFLRLGGSDVMRLDYAPRDIFIRASNWAERRRGKSCSAEPWTVSWIEKNVGPEDVFYDVGANVGVFSLLAAKRMGTAGRVVAFEPGYASYARLCENIVLNSCADKVIPVGLPLSHKTEVMQFLYRDLEPGQDRHVLKAVRQERNAKYSQPVLAFRLDELAKTFRLPAPHAVRICVDGGETWMLQGAEEILRGPSLRSVLVDVDGAQSGAVERLMSGAGFRLSERFQGRNKNGEAKSAWCGVFEKTRAMAAA